MESLCSVNIGTLILNFSFSRLSVTLILREKLIIFFDEGRVSHLVQEFVLFSKCLAKDLKYFLNIGYSVYLTFVVFLRPELLSRRYYF